MHEVLYEILHAIYSEKSANSIDEIAPTHEWSPLVTTLDQLYKLNGLVSSNDQEFLVTSDMDLSIHCGTTNQMYIINSITTRCSCRLMNLVCIDLCGCESDK